MRRKLTKHHVEEKYYNGEERRHLYIDCHLLLQALLLPNMYHSLSLLQDLQEMENTKEEEEEH